MEQIKHFQDAQFEVLAQEYGTPYFLYDADTVGERVASLKNAFGNGILVLFAVKANPNLGLLRKIRCKVDGLDISSVGEFHLAQAAKYDPEVLSFAGPAKSHSELETVITGGIGCVSVESMRELEACEQIARTNDCKARVMMRINPEMLNRYFGMKMGGKPVQFGIDEEEIDEAIRFSQLHEGHIEFLGIHVYVGSQCFEVAGIVDVVFDTLKIVDRIESSSSLACRKVNFGGGFGLSHKGDGRELSVVELAEQLSPELRVNTEKAKFQREFVFELGRYLCADAGIYVTRVIGKKYSRGTQFIITDGGLHHHLSAAGTFGTALRCNYPMVNLTDGSRPTVRCSIAGPSCNPTDLLGVGVELSEPEEGDLLGVLSAGSYGLTASPVFFLGRDTPAELVSHSGEISLGRKRMGILDFA